MIKKYNFDQAKYRAAMFDYLMNSDEFKFLAGGEVKTVSYRRRLNIRIARVINRVVIGVIRIENKTFRKEQPCIQPCLVFGRIHSPDTFVGIICSECIVCIIFTKQMSCIFPL